jgi:hypothetical protein
MSIEDAKVQVFSRQHGCLMQKLQTCMFSKAYVRIWIKVAETDGFKLIS